MKNIKFLFIVGLITALGACTFQTKQRGYIFPENLASEIATIKTTTQLENKIGSPQVKTVHGSDVWVYYGVTENFRGPLPLTYDNKTVLLAWVDRAGGVTKTQILYDVDLPDLDIDTDETKIPAAIELNAIQELFNNVGRFTPAGLGQ